MRFLSFSVLISKICEIYTRNSVFSKNFPIFWSPKRKEKNCWEKNHWSLCLNHYAWIIMTYIYIYIFQGSLFFLIVISSDFLIASPCQKNLRNTWKKPVLIWCKTCVFQQKFATFAKSKKNWALNFFEERAAVMIVSSENGQQPQYWTTTRWDINPNNI